MSKYVTKLKDDEIKTFLEENGYELAVIFDDDGQEMPSIDRSNNNIFVRCKNKQDNQMLEQIKGYLLSSRPKLYSFLLLGRDYFEMPDILLFKEFEIERLSTIDTNLENDCLNINYIKMMTNKFGEKYIQEYKDSDMSK